MAALRESWAVSGVGSWQAHESRWSCLVQGGDLQPGGGELCRVLGEKGVCPLGPECPCVTISSDRVCASRGVL